jgi:hypothetical protein
MKILKRGLIFRHKYGMEAKVMSFSNDEVVLQFIATGKIITLDFQTFDKNFKNNDLT